MNTAPPIVRTCLAVAVACALGLGPTHAHDEKVHDLADSVLCIDETSVTLQFENVGAGRAAAARRELTRALDGSLRGSLIAAGIPFEAISSCAGRTSFVAVVVRITQLDPAIYRHYGSRAFGLALGVQVGSPSDAAYLASHHVLPGLRFIAFEEQVALETATGPGFEARVAAGSRALLQELVAAWREDNP